MVRRGDIVIANVPYQNDEGEFETKKRPVLVLSWKGHNQHRKDAIVVKVTSVKKQKFSEWDVVITASDLEKNKLEKPSKIVCDSIHTINTKHCGRLVGRVKQEKMKEIVEKIENLIRWRP